MALSRLSPRPPQRSELIISLSPANLPQLQQQFCRHSCGAEVGFLRRTERRYNIGNGGTGLTLVASQHGCSVASVRRSQASAAAGTSSLTTSMQPLVHRTQQRLLTAGSGRSDNFDLDMSELERVLSSAMFSIRLGGARAEAMAAGDGLDKRRNNQGIQQLRSRRCRGLSAPSLPPTELETSVAETVILQPVGLYDLGSSALFSVHPLRRRSTDASGVSASVPVRRRTLSGTGQSHKWGRWTLERRK